MKVWRVYFDWLGSPSGSVDVVAENISQANHDALKIEQKQGKTMYGFCPYCKRWDYNVIIMLHIANCPKNTKEANGQ